VKGNYHVIDGKGGDVRNPVEFGKRACFLSVGWENLKEGEHPHEREVA
jgi:hypothetical protein